MSVIIIAPENDIHGAILRKRIIDKGGEAQTWNLSLFPWRQRASWTPTGNLFFTGDNAPDLQPDDVVWWRRYGGPVMHPSISDPTVRQFCESEVREFVRGSFIGLNRIVNRPSKEFLCNSKMEQLKAAYFLDILIPETLISNDISAMKKFIEANPRVISKTIRCDYPHSIPTKEVTLSDIPSDRDGDLAPVILQELVECTADIRVFVVGNDCFAAEIVRENANIEVDWRFGPQKWEKHNLPNDIKGKLIRIIREFGLHTGSIDLRLRKNGDYVFLEINPSGQFMFLEIDAGLNVSNCLADYLMNPSKWDA